jgi:hypothetical protein
MLKTASLSPAGIRKKTALTNHLWRVSAAILSLAAHLFLIVFVDIQLLRTRAMSTEDDVPDNVVTMRLDKPEAHARNTEEVAPVVRAKPHKSSPLPPNPRTVIEEVPPPVVEVLAPPEPYYFSTADLTEKPRVIRDIPSDLSDLFVKGKPYSAVFRLLINELGEIDQVIIDSSTFPLLEQNRLVDAFSKMQFDPGKMEAVPVRSEMRIEILVEKVTPPVTPYPDLR